VVTRADSFAFSIRIPAIELDLSITSTTATSICSRMPSGSKRTGSICSTRVPL
jgi:hypothetical protein